MHTRTQRLHEKEVERDYSMDVIEKIMDGIAAAKTEWHYSDGYQHSNKEMQRRRQKIHHRASKHTFQ
ncbi:MAG: hypothetical protein HPY63_08360 [Methanobacteriaceae archaeon]|nr:hypothetical protein [Methanobacteriaceae archaeon]